MIKKILLIVVVLFITLFSKAQIVDVTPNGDENYRSVEGGSQKVIIDKLTSLNVLIERLKKPWKFIETGKGYWIGYTDDMYSIAAHSVYAIRPLIELVGTTNDLHTKIGAIYTLHLIGINRKIAGRFSENFTDKNARNALLYLLKYPELTETIMTLLIRDPWQSDVQNLFETIKIQKSEYWCIISALPDYKLLNYPLNGKLPDQFNQILFTIPYKAGFSSDDFDIQFHQCLEAIKQLKNPNIYIEEQLLQMTKLWGNSKFGMNEVKERNNQLYLTVTDFLITVAGSSYMSSYMSIGSKLNYYFEGGKLYMCTPETARNIAIKWWNNQTNIYKQQFSVDTEKK